MAGGKTGQIFLENFDVGVATTLGASLIDITLDREVVQAYAVAIDGVTGPEQYRGLVPVMMADSEDAFQENLIPLILISRGDVMQDMRRWFPGGHEYQAPAASAKTVPGPGGRLMPTIVEKKWWTYPYEISYDISLKARLRRQADRMFLHVGRIFWAYGQVFLRDSEGDERGYYAFSDSVPNLSEIADVADRLQGHTISLRVEGELDFHEPFLMPTAQRVTNTVGRR